MQSLSNISDEVLIRDLHMIASSHRTVTAELILHLGEMDARRLHLDRGFSSLFSYCVEELHFSEDEACRRIAAARLARKFPPIYSLLSAGAVSLTLVGLLKPHLKNENHGELLTLVSFASVREARERLAARFPQPDVPSMIRKLPAPRAPREILHAPPLASMFGSDSPAPPRIEPALPRIEPASPRTEPASLRTEPASLRTEPASRTGPVPLPEVVFESAQRTSSRSRVEPLSQDRFLVKFTATRALKEKLELARDLMRHGNPGGELVVVVERALDLLVAELRKTKQGRTGRPLHSPRPARGSQVTDAARRDVVERDGWRCSFVAEDGRRCDAQGFLEFDHRVPKGCGGTSRAENLRLLCRGHNQREAERVYGKELMARAILREEAKRRARPHPAIAEGPAALSSFPMAGNR